MFLMTPQRSSECPRTRRGRQRTRVPTHGQLEDQEGFSWRRIGVYIGGLIRSLMGLKRSPKGLQRSNSQERMSEE